MAQPGVWVNERPILSLSLIYILWKSVILSVAYFSPGIGYDTSTSLLDHTYTGAYFQDVEVPVALSLSRKLVRWDAIYYVHLASEGHVFEQEWAFGTGLSTTVSSLTHFVSESHAPNIDDYVMTGIIVSHAAHWLAMILVWLIAHKCIKPESMQRASVAFVAAVLHIISPAGIFLSAPYSESLFSCLNLLGFYLYLLDGSEHSLMAFLNVTSHRILSGLVFGCATMIRSNGLFSGLPFLMDALLCARSMGRRPVGLHAMRSLMQKLFVTGLGGACIAVGMIIPQFIAYNQYCIGVETPRSWCTAMPPSIYTFVQSHYWNVGFLHYWSLSNIPLFVLATPVLYLMIQSGWDACLSSQKQRLHSQIQTEAAVRLALPQLVLAVLAFTNFHVQIITRLAPAYPLWYIWVATRVHDSGWSNVVVRTMVLYGVIQAALYSSFLPPA